MATSRLRRSRSAIPGHQYPRRQRPSPRRLDLLENVGTTGGGHLNPLAGDGEYLAGSSRAVARMALQDFDPVALEGHRHARPGLEGTDPAVYLLRVQLPVERPVFT